MRETMVGQTTTKRPDVEAESQTSTERAEDSGESVAGETDQVPEAPLDVVFEVLRNQRRRAVLRYLQGHDDDTVEIGDLAEHIAAAENDKPVAQINSAERKRVYVGLYQCHLPKMDDAGAIDYNQSRGFVELSGVGGQFLEHLDPVSDGDTTRWERYYGALAAVTFTAFAGIIGGVLPAWVAPTAVLGVASVAFVACSLAHFVSAGRRDPGA